MMNPFVYLKLVKDVQRVPELQAKGKPQTNSNGPQNLPAQLFPTRIKHTLQKLLMSRY